MATTGPGKWRWLRRLGFAGGPAAAAAYFLQGAGQDLPTWGFWLTIGGGTLITLMAGLAEARSTQDALAVATSARAEATRPLNAVIAPALSSLELIADSTTDEERKTRQERLKQLVVSLALRLGPRTRACYYDLVIEHSPGGPVRTLRCDDSYGLWLGTADRTTPPRKSFRDNDANDIAGTDKFRMLDDRDIVLVRDATQTPPRGWPHGRDYQTFIGVPVASAKDVFGYLGVDSSRAGDLSVTDAAILRQLAQILAIGLSIR